MVRVIGLQLGSLGWQFLRMVQGSNSAHLNYLFEPSTRRQSFGALVLIKADLMGSQPLLINWAKLKPNLRPLASIKALS